MRNNILGGLVVFFVVVACLLMIDDISSQGEQQAEITATDLNQQQPTTDLAVIEEDN
jgi:hypothetical protein